MSMDRRRAESARNAAYRRARSRGRYASSRRREESTGISRLFLVVMVLLLAVGLRLTSGGRLEIFREGIGGVIEDGGGVKEAVAVLGQALVFQGEGKEESAVVTFGKKLLGFDGEEKAQPNENSSDLQDVEPPENNHPEEVSPEQGEPTAAGEISGLSADRLVMPVIMESPMPEKITVATLRFDLSEEETDDSDTPNEPFEIPSPDKVDDTKYTLPFSYQRPLSNYRVTSGFGYRIHPIHGNTTFHYGVDLAAAQGTRVNSFAGGTVAETGYHAVYGNYVLVSHSDGFASFYGHLQKIYVKTGTKVSEGQKIAAVGNTGWSTGPHLHFEMRRNGLVLDPFDYMTFQ